MSYRHSGRHRHSIQIRAAWWHVCFNLAPIIVTCSLMCRIFRYEFAPSSSITISEFLKLCLSTIFFYREYRKRVALAGGTYQSLALNSVEDDEPLDDDDKLFQQDSKSAPSSLGFTEFWKSCWNETSQELKYGFAQLALFYALINNTVRLSSLGFGIEPVKMLMLAI